MTPIPPLRHRLQAVVGEAFGIDHEARHGKDDPWGSFDIEKPVRMGIRHQQKFTRKSVTSRVIPLRHCTGTSVDE
jgi:hypothetical protein